MQKVYLLCNQQQPTSCCKQEKELIKVNYRKNTPVV